jgi:hypothetical protein
LRLLYQNAGEEKLRMWLVIKHLASMYKAMGEVGGLETSGALELRYLWYPNLNTEFIYLSLISYTQSMRVILCNVFSIPAF